MQDNRYLIALNNFPKFGPASLKKLKKFFSSWEHAFKAKLNDLKQAGINENIAQEFISARINIVPDQLLARLEKENIKVITLSDKLYPKLLAEIYDPPQLLYYKGALDNLDEFALAVVGTRKFTSYGKQVVEKIVKDLAENKLTIVSGLAFGIDCLAHNAALEIKGKTSAVLGCGIDKQSIYPSANRFLADRIIAEGGAIVTEFALGTPPLKYHFPQRNRLISGLTLGTLVVEAGEKSGALITAYHALEQNREVFTIPGSIYSPASLGPNKLIKQGAKTVTEARDILEALDLAQVSTFIENKKIIAESSEEKLILEHLTHEAIHIDELIRLTKLLPGIINSTLTMMEMKGMVRNLGGMQYVLAR